MIGGSVDADELLDQFAAAGFFELVVASAGRTGGGAGDWS